LDLKTSENRLGKNYRNDSLTNSAHLIMKTLRHLLLAIVFASVCPDPVHAATSAAKAGKIRFDPLPIAAVGDKPIKLKVKSGGPVRFTSSNQRVAKVSGNQLRILRPGRTNITAIPVNGTSRSVRRSLVVGSRPQMLGSTLQATPNLLIGADTAPIFDPITGQPILVPSNQQSCTLRNVGYIGTLQAGSMVPASGVIRNIRVRCGPNPAPMQVLIMSGSPGLYGTALRASPIFRPRANAITTVRVDLPVTRSFQPGTNIIDAVALNVVGAGTMPLSDQGTAGTYSPGSSLLQHWYPTMRPGLPENERAYTIDGIELLFSWEFIQVGDAILQ
jgi:hypothetical protein